MVMDRFTIENEGTYTVQIEDGNAKNQSSLVLIGDGKFTEKFGSVHEKQYISIILLSASATNSLFNTFLPLF